MVRICSNGSYVYVSLGRLGTTKRSMLIPRSLHTSGLGQFLFDGGQHFEPDRGTFVDDDPTQALVLDELFGSSGRIGLGVLPFDADISE